MIHVGTRVMPAANEPDGINTNAGQSENAHNRVGSFSGAMSSDFQVNPPGARAPGKGDLDTAELYVSASRRSSVLNFVENVAYHRLSMALRMISQDPMGKEAVVCGLKNVKLTNVKSAAAEEKLAFEGGTLEMAGAYGQQGLGGAWSDGEIRELLTAKL